VFLFNSILISNEKRIKNFKLSDVEEEQTFSKFDEDSFEPSGRFTLFPILKNYNYYFK